MSQIPEIGYMKISQILGNPKASPPIPAIIPVSRSTWHKWVKEGRAPRPLMIGPKISLYPVDEVRKLATSLFGGTFGANPVAGDQK